MGEINTSFHSYFNFLYGIICNVYNHFCRVMPESAANAIFSNIFSGFFKNNSTQINNTESATVNVSGDSFSTFLYESQNYGWLGHHLYNNGSNSNGSYEDKINDIISTLQSDRSENTNLVLGTSNSDILTGNSRNDIIIGGSNSDLMTGDSGNDIYFVDNMNDKVVELADGGTDTVKSYISYELGDNVENLTLLGTGNINATGNELDNIIEGNSGNNVINGDSGDDQLSGNAGDDTLYGSDGDDILKGGTGNDQLYGEADNDYLYGAEGADQLLGGSGNDYIEAGADNDIINGGAGNDYMLSGAGNDTLIDESGSDLYNFSKGDGLDNITDFDSTLEDIDTIEFTEGINKEDVAVFMNNNDLVVGYGDSDQITIKNQAEESYGIEIIQLADGDYLTAEDINMIIQEMTAYANTQGFAITSVEQVQANPDLMNIVMNGWG